MAYSRKDARRVLTSDENLYRGILHDEKITSGDGYLKCSIFCSNDIFITIIVKRYIYIYIYIYIYNNNLLRED